MTRMRIGIALAALSLVCSPVWAGPISDSASSAQLVGGVVTVTRFGGVTTSATFVADGTGASASAPGSGGFSLTVGPGDTADATWTLTNTDQSPVFFNTITAVTIDLGSSEISLFDSGSEPSTPDSGPGIPGVTHLAGVSVSNATDLLAWPDLANLGDMFRAVSITFVDIGPGASASWRDDTDTIAAVPEPTSNVLIGSGLLLLLLISRTAVGPAQRNQFCRKRITRALASFVASMS